MKGYRARAFADMEGNTPVGILTNLRITLRLYECTGTCIYGGLVRAESRIIPGDGAALNATECKTLRAV